MNSRSKNSLRNSAVSSISQAINLLLSYFTRIVFAQVLGASYLGVESLFANVVGVLGIIDLGLNSVMYFKLYGPLSEHDPARVASYVQYFKKIFSAIGVILLVLSLLFAPFTSKLIKDNPFTSTELSVYFLMYAVFSFSSYFFVHARSLLFADQKGYVSSLAELITKTTTRILQIWVLLKFGSFALYLCLDILYSLISNAVIALYTKRNYPDLKTTHVPLEVLERKDIFANVKWLSIGKIATVGVGSTDGILISYFLGASILGVYSNYYMLISALFGIFSIPITSIIPSFANLTQDGDPDKTESVFQTYGFLSYLIAAAYSMIIVVAMQDVIKLSFGADYILPLYDVLIICSNYFLMLIFAPVWNAISVKGLFRKALPLNILQFVLNLIVSVVLVKWIGLPGVFLGTLVSIIVSYTAAVFMLSSQVHYISAGRYFRKMALYIVISAATVLICYFGSNVIHTQQLIVDLILKVILCMAFFCGFNLFAFRRTAVYGELMKMLRKALHRRENDAGE